MFNNLMLPNRCQFAPISVTNGVVKPFVRRDTSFPLDGGGGLGGNIVHDAVHVFYFVDDTV